MCDANPCGYAEILETLKTFFPVPVSNPILDGYFVHTLSRFLDQVDALKSAAPLLAVAHDTPTGQEPAFPDAMTSVEEAVDLIVQYCEGMTIWSHPNASVNVVPPSTIASITAFIATAMYNPNIIWDAYSARFAEAEIQAVAQAADLIGYDPQLAGGVFTFGGTGTNLYAMKLALERCTGGRAMHEGVRSPVQFVASEASHYSRLNVAGWLGIGSDHVITVPISAENSIALSALEETLRRAFDAGETVAGIIATMGTTDAFGIDALARMVALRDTLAREYNLPHPPHIHADAVIGWAWAVFRDYDFIANPLSFHARTLDALQQAVSELRYLHLADSVGIDFHKTGYAPYISSLFLVRDRNQLALLSREPEEMPYLYQFGHYEPGLYTLECSRAGSGALAALVNMRLFGKMGYRVLIGHVVEMAEHLRARLAPHPFIKVLNDRNVGPVTIFRVYPPGTDAACYERELNDRTLAGQVEAINDFNRRVFEHIYTRALRGEGVLLSRTEAYRHTAYPDGPPLLGIKSYIMSPWTDMAAVEMTVRQVVEAYEALNGEAGGWAAAA